MKIKTEHVKILNLIKDESKVNTEISYSLGLSLGDFYSLRDSMCKAGLLEKDYTDGDFYHGGGKKPKNKITKKGLAVLKLHDALIE